MPKHFWGASPFPLPSVPLLEHWKPVVGFETSYEVSNIGNVRSIARRDRRGRLWESKILQPQFHANTGYLSVYPTKNNKRETRRIHYLVSAAFLGPRPLDLVVNHKDGNKRNNRLSNLGYVTFFENVRHAFRTGLNDATLKAVRSRSPLSPEDVRYIRANPDEMKLTDLGKKFGVSMQCIWDVKNRRNWKHIE